MCVSRAENSIPTATAQENKQKRALISANTTVKCKKRSKSILKSTIDLHTSLKEKNFLAVIIINFISNRNLVVL